MFCKLADNLPCQFLSIFFLYQFETQLHWWQILSQNTGSRPWKRSYFFQSQNLKLFIQWLLDQNSSSLFSPNIFPWDVIRHNRTAEYMRAVLGAWCLANLKLIFKAKVSGSTLTQGKSSVYFCISFTLN